MAVVGGAIVLALVAMAVWWGDLPERAAAALTTPTGSMFVSDPTSHRILKVNTVTGRTIETIDLGADTAGDVVVSETPTALFVRSIGADGAVTLTSFSTSTLRRTGSRSLTSTALTFVGDRHVWIADGDRARPVDATTLTTTGPERRLDGFDPVRAVVHDDGRLLYVDDRDEGRSVAVVVDPGRARSQRLSLGGPGGTAAYDSGEAVVVDPAAAKVIHLSSDGFGDADDASDLVRGARYESLGRAVADSPFVAFAGRAGLAVFELVRGRRSVLAFAEPQTLRVPVTTSDSVVVGSDGIHLIDRMSGGVTFVAPDRRTVELDLDRRDVVHTDVHIAPGVLAINATLARRAVVVRGATVRPVEFPSPSDAASPVWPSAQTPRSSQPDVAPTGASEPASGTPLRDLRVRTDGGGPGPAGVGDPGTGSAGSATGPGGPGAGVGTPAGDGSPGTSEPSPSPTLPLTQLAATHLAAGNGHTCAVTAAATVRCWGHNTFGQLGDGTRADRPTPVDVPGLSDVIAITAGGEATCAISAPRGSTSGSAVCWGARWSADGGTSQPTPTLVAGLPPVRSISTGGLVWCAVTDAWQAYCWGNNITGTLGDGTTMGRPTPEPVPGLGEVRTIATSGSRTCAARFDGTVACWGSVEVDDGAIRTQPFPGGTPAVVPVPRTMNGPTGVTSFALSGQGVCAIAATGAVWCWGSVTSPLLGIGGGVNEPGPLARLTEVRSIGLGAFHGCAVLQRGALWCFGANLGWPTSLTDVLPWIGSDLLQAPFLVPDLPPVAQLAVGAEHTCVLLVDGSVHCFGANTRGQLGDGRLRIHPTPLRVADRVAEVTTGDGFTCAVDDVRTIRCAGDNSLGQLGDDVGWNRPFGPVAGLGSVTTVAAGVGRACAIATSPDARPWCWGRSAGRGRDEPTSAAPRLVGGVGAVTDLDVGSDHACAATTAGRVVCWGNNGWGQLGVPEPGPGPHTVAGLTGIVSVDTAGNHTCAVDGAGRVFCWGDNYSGQLGDGSTIPRYEPVRAAVTDAVDVAAGIGFTCALHRSGRVSCWGDSWLGSLGQRLPDGEYHSLTPVDVPGVVDAVSIDAGPRGVCVVAGSGAVTCWGSEGSWSGSNAGDGAVEVPRRLTGLPPAAKVAVGSTSSCAVTAGNELWCWGDTAAFLPDDGMPRRVVGLDGP